MKFFGSQLKKAVVIFAGIIFLILGVIGLALPFLQGFLFILVGLVLLSLASTRTQAWMESHTRKYPKAHKVVEKVQAWARRVIGPIE